MGYCTLDDLISDFGEDEIIRLSDRSRPPTKQIDPVVVEKAITDATNEINMYFEARNLLPLASVPPVLVRIAGDITRYYLYTNPSAEHPVTLRYKDRCSQLAKVANGTLSLGLNAEGEPVDPQGTVEFQAGDNMFSRPGGGLW
jgi:phage gp36-like protein